MFLLILLSQCNPNVFLNQSWQSNIVWPPFWGIMRLVIRLLVMHTGDMTKIGTSHDKGLLLSCHCVWTPLLNHACDCSIVNEMFDNVKHFKKGGQLKKLDTSYWRRLSEGDCLHVPRPWCHWNDQVKFYNFLNGCPFQGSLVL